MAAMEIFGSYMGKDCTLAGEGAKICDLDTFVAIMSGLIIFPACFSSVSYTQLYLCCLRAGVLQERAVCSVR